MEVQEHFDPQQIRSRLHSQLMAVVPVAVDEQGDTLCDGDGAVQAVRKFITAEHLKLDEITEHQGETLWAEANILYVCYDLLSFLLTKE